MDKILPIDLLPSLLQRIPFVPIKLFDGLFDLLLVFQYGRQHLLQGDFLLLDAVHDVSRTSQ